MPAIHFPLLLALLLLLPLGSRAEEEPAPQPPLSSSKLSIHLIERYTPGARAIVAAGPRLLKILDLGPEMRMALRDYKARFPQGKNVLRIYTRQKFTLQDEPEKSARSFWREVLWPPIEKLPPEERALIDYLEGPNEGDSTPCWATVEDTRWFARFWTTLAPLMRAHGLAPCVGSIPVGNPPGDAQGVRARLEAFVPARLAARAAGGAWSYHAYTIGYTRDLSEEIWFSLRYRCATGKYLRFCAASTRPWPRCR